MSSEQYQRTVNSLDKEIADLEKKKAAKDKEVATLQGKINTLKKSMDKLRMQTANKADENFRKLAAMFPNAVTETINENGEVVRAIDKDVLMQEIACSVVDGNEERYQFTWPDKKKSVLLANAPINKTLRPCREESVDFDTTENLYIEGDNLEVLKLLQETYLGKIKMIYIDPPYNTGSDCRVRTILSSLLPLSKTWGVAALILKWKPARAKPMSISRRCSS